MKYWMVLAALLLPVQAEADDWSGPYAGAFLGVGLASVGMTDIEPLPSFYSI